MKTRMLLACACLITSVASANVVTVVAYGTLASFSDPEGLLPFTEADAMDGFQFSVTYDDSSADHYLEVSQVGLYVSAVEDMQLAVGTVQVPALEQKSIIILDDVSSTGGSPADFWIANSQKSVVLDADGNTRNWTLEFYLYGLSDTLPAAPLSSDALVEPPSLHNWTGARIRYRIEDYDAADNLLGTPAEAMALVDVFSVNVSEVPLPATAWMFPVALAAAGLRGRRR